MLQDQISQAAEAFAKNPEAFRAAAEAATAESGAYMAKFGAAIGAGLAPLGAALGIGRIGGQANEAIARQPDASADIRGASILFAALIEGVALFAVVVTLLVALG